MNSSPHLKAKGAAIKARRLALFLTHAELAEKSGVSATTLKAMEKGAGNLRLSTIRKLAKFFSCEPSDISEVDGVPEEAAS